MDKIKELELLLQRERAAKIICSELNSFVELKPTLVSIMNRLKELTDIEAIGIRLHDDGDYPYYIYKDFPEEFIRLENSLCSRDSEGRRICKEGVKRYLLDCMCGNIITGNTDSSHDFFTDHGSFWSNQTTQLLEMTTEEDRQSRTRNRCNSFGYESVALIPIKIGQETTGLIQFNDRRKNMFNLDLIEYLEMIGEQVGLAIKNSMTYTKLKEALESIKVLKGMIPICASCKKVRDDKGFWQQVEEYLGKHSDAQFSHGICPECSKKLYPDYT